MYIKKVTTDKRSRAFLKPMEQWKSKFDINLTKKKIIERFRIWKEHTNTSPSNHLLRHFRALLYLFKAADADKKEEIKNMRAEIITVHFKMVTYSLLPRTSMYTQDGFTLSPV